MAAAHYKFFPFNQIKTAVDNVIAFVKGDVNEDTTLAQKLINDLGIAPERLIREFKAQQPERFQTVSLDGTRGRRAAPRVWLSKSAPEHYRLIAGAFDFDKAFWGAILIDPAGKVVHRWHLNGEIPELTDNADTLKDLYGVAFLPDGSTVFTMQEVSGGLIKRDYCSRLQWTKKGDFHHTAQPTEDNTAFWTFGGQQGDMHPTLVLVDAATGKTLKTIDMAEVEKANPGIYIFDLRHSGKRKRDHATHPNDIEPLPKALAPLYPRFSAGDLVLSYHTTNLIFVLDPQTLKIKWWYSGAGDGQHDPDWQSDGTISIFNNFYRADRRDMPMYSTIVSIDPANNTHRTVVDGKRFNFYSRINGHHQFTGKGTVIITSSTQGRVFEVRPETGETVFEYVNAYDWDTGRTLHLSETFIIDKDTAERWLKTDCSTAGPNEGSRK